MQFQARGPDAEALFHGAEGLHGEVFLVLIFRLAAGNGQLACGQKFGLKAGVEREGEAYGIEARAGVAGGGGHAKLHRMASFT